VHRDIKPDNILVHQMPACASDEILVKLIDFGTSALVENDMVRLHKKVGTAYYVAPEVLQAEYGP
jgi:calcium-dependent protein kinase